MLEAKVKELSQSLKPGETKYIKTSMDFNGSAVLSEGDSAPSLDQKLAYGKVKLAICIEKDAKGNISYSGEVGDTYDFDWHEFGDQSGYNFVMINNIAVKLQEEGALQPFNWIASIKGKIQGGKK